MFFLEDHLRDIYEVLKEKEIALARVRREVEALRLVCTLLCDEGDSTPITLKSAIKLREKREVVRRVDGRADERAAALAQIRARFVDAQPQTVQTKIESERGVLLQFREIALGASRTLLKRVRNSRLLEPEFQRKTVQDLFERLRLSNAA